MESKLTNFPQEERISLFHKFCEHIREHWYVYSCLMLSICAAVFFMMHRHYNSSNIIDGAIWGQYGDFIGGVLGTLVSVLSVYYLIKTLNEQREANKLVDNNNKYIADVYVLQQFNSNFSTLLGLYSDSVKYYSEGQESGKPVMRNACNSLFVKFNANENYPDVVGKAAKIFEDFFYIPNRDIASVHFRTLYQIFDLISTSTIGEGKKVLYAKMIRSQLCEEELLLLRYNCTCSYGENMRRYFNTYNLLKHLPLLSLGEFKRWKDFLKDKNRINRMDSEFIYLRKQIFNIIKSENKESKSGVKEYSQKYSIFIEAAENNSQIKLELIKKEKQQETVVLKNGEVIDDIFDLFNDSQITNIFSDFLYELFVYSNFGVFNKIDDFVIETSVNNKYAEIQTKSIVLIAKKKKYPLSLSYNDLYSPIKN